MKSTYYANRKDGKKCGRRYTIDTDNIKMSDILWYSANYHLASDMQSWCGVYGTAKYACVATSEFVAAHSWDRNKFNSKRFQELSVKRLAVLRFLETLGCPTGSLKAYEDCELLNFEEIQQYRYSWLMAAYQIALEEEAQQALEEQEQQQHAAQRPLPINYVMPTAE